MKCIPADLMNAATKIQASFRGHMARKQAEKSKTDGEITKEMEKLQSKVEELDVDLSDPGLNHAAVKIQASFRGHMTRKTLVKD
ncbi:hypothetical protein DAPPUDRAFT_44253 [Daphnia pulex]|uniref:Uncharacterized protein n=1 Tax=Daphnia pulex TaxID=6669 RepID=E9G170_DAPPU|nr:hypothetical protein DAPPUDRAFT_44253 [Daphnia pulex]|eukprot:EFX86621.1 hypothetical protein DAPPUDRAFT_44253 [Daphnia pulex]